MLFVAPESEKPLDESRGYHNLSLDARDMSSSRNCRGDVAQLLSSLDARDMSSSRNSLCALVLICCSLDARDMSSSRNYGGCCIE